MSKNKATLLKEFKNIVENFLKENTEGTPIKINNKVLYLFHIKQPFKDYIYIEDKNGELYYDITTILPENQLLDAVWVKMNDDVEKIANKINFLKATDVITKSGYNQYRKFDIVY